MLSYCLTVGYSPVIINVSLGRRRGRKPKAVRS